MCCQGKGTLALNKPEYIGKCILELSKLSMYKLHYDCIKKNMVTNQDSYLQTVIV